MSKHFSLLFHHLALIHRPNSILPFICDVITPPMHPEDVEENTRRGGTNHVRLPLFSSHSVVSNVVTSLRVPSALVREETLKIFRAFAGQSVRVEAWWRELLSTRGLLSSITTDRYPTFFGPSEPKDRRVHQRITLSAFARIGVVFTTWTLASCALPLQRK